MLQKRGISYGMTKGKREMDFSIVPCQTEEHSPVVKKPKFDSLKETSSEASDLSTSIPGLHHQFCSLV